MAKPTHQQLLEAGVHFGHLRRKWNPKMSPYIFTEKNGIHLIDLNRTLENIDRAGKSGRLEPTCPRISLFLFRSLLSLSVGSLSCRY